MATKDISDIQVLQAYKKAKLADDKWPYDFLMEETGQPLKVCFRAMERCCGRGYVDYGTSLRSGWITEKGLKLITNK